MFENEVIDRYMNCIMKNFKINAQVCILSLADLNLCHCVKLKFLECKLGRSLILTFLKLIFLKTYCTLKME